MTTLATPKFTWHDLAPCDDGHERVDADRSDLPFASPVVQAASKDIKVGGLLLWNKTLDAEHGRIVMFNGQTALQERVVMENAGWMISCGAVYAAERVGTRGYKARPDHRIKIESHAFYVWLLSNCEAIEPRAMADTVRLIEQEQLA